MTTRRSSSTFPFRWELLSHPSIPTGRDVSSILKRLSVLVVASSNAVACTVCRYLEGFVYIGEGFCGIAILVLLPPAQPHGHEALDRTAQRLGRYSATFCTASVQCMLPHHFASWSLVLMLVRKGHNVVVPWPGHDVFYPQPMAQGGLHTGQCCFVVTLIATYSRLHTRGHRSTVVLWYPEHSRPKHRGFHRISAHVQCEL